MDLRRLIRKELDRQMMTQTRLAKLAHMTLPRVNDYLNGKRDVYAKTAGRMLEVLGLEVRPTHARRVHPQAKTTRTLKSGTRQVRLKRKAR